MAYPSPVLLLRSSFELLCKHPGSDESICSLRMVWDSNLDSGSAIYQMTNAMTGDMPQKCQIYRHL